MDKLPVCFILITDVTFNSPHIVLHCIHLDFFRITFLGICRTLHPGYFTNMHSIDLE